MLFNLADHVFITDLVSRKRLLDANGKRSAVDAGAEISGPALGGALVALFTLCGSFMASLYTLYALRDLGLSTTQLGLAIGCGGVGALIGAAFAAPSAARWGTRRTLMASLALTAVMQVFIPLAPAVPRIGMLFLVAQQIVGDGAMTVYLVNETTLRQRLLPQEALGRSAATWQVANGLLTPAGARLGAVLAETIGLRPTLWVLAFGFAAAFVWLFGARGTLPGRNAEVTGLQLVELH